MKNKSLITCAFLFIFTVSGKADIFHTYGFGAKGISLGNAQVAQADSTSAVFYNPAGLGRMQGDAIGFTYMYSKLSMEIFLPETEPSAYTDSKLSTGMIMTDLAIDINRFFNLPVNITFGLGFNISDDLKIVRFEDIEENNYRFLRYGAQVERSALYTGVGIELFEDRLWAGGGGHAMINGDVAANITVEPEDLSTTDPVKPSKQDIWVDMKGQMSPTIGIIISPFKNLLAGFSFKEKINMTVDPVLLNLDIPVGNGHILPTVVTAISSYYIPRTYRLGTAYSFSNITIEIAYSREIWSDFKFSSFREETRIIHPFSDANTYHVGFQLDDIWIFTLRGGYQFSETPVPEQTGESNLFDSDRHIFSFGTAFELNDRFGIIRKPILFEFALQKQMMTEKSFKGRSGDKTVFEGSSMAAVVSITFHSHFHSARLNDKESNELDEKNIKAEKNENENV